MGCSPQRLGMKGERFRFKWKLIWCFTITFIKLELREDCSYFMKKFATNDFFKKIVTRYKKIVYNINILHSAAACMHGWSASCG